MGRKHKKKHKNKEITVPRFSIIHVQQRGEKYILHTLKYGIKTEELAWDMYDILVDRLGFPEKELEVREYKVKLV